jgi:copper(I)-binding protein
MHLSTSARQPLVRLGALLAVVALMGACGGSSSASAGAGSASGSGSASGGTIEISGAWARESAMVSGAGAAYMVIKNTGSEADALLGGSSPAAKSVEVHETVMMEASPAASSGGMGTGGASPAAGGGMMGMQKVDKLEIPANGSVELKPGSYHLMLIELTAPLKVGEKIDITLTFEKAGDVKVTAEVKAG